MCSDPSLRCCLRCLQLLTVFFFIAVYHGQVLHNFQIRADRNMLTYNWSFTKITIKTNWVSLLQTKIHVETWCKGNPSEQEFSRWQMWFLTFFLKKGYYHVNNWVPLNDLRTFWLPPSTCIPKAASGRWSPVSTFRCSGKLSMPAALPPTQQLVRLLSDQVMLTSRDPEPPPGVTWRSPAPLYALFFF